MHHLDRFRRIFKDNQRRRQKAEQVSQEKADLVLLVLPVLLAERTFQVAGSPFLFVPGELPLVA
jgi:hypothetical protein